MEGIQLPSGYGFISLSQLDKLLSAIVQQPKASTGIIYDPHHLLFLFLTFIGHVRFVLFEHELDNFLYVVSFKMIHLF